MKVVGSNKAIEKEKEMEKQIMDTVRWISYISRRFSMIPPSIGCSDLFETFPDLVVGYI